MSNNTRRNELAREASPYLRQHKNNPVHWQVWCAHSFQQAEQENKPVLLSIGYAACHWCHVMAKESFADSETAQLMNELFINIKLDREERPDIDDIYMNALHMMGEQGGWPLTIFLTPQGEPFWGGTYFPKTAQYGRPAFKDILREISRLYQAEPDKIMQNAKQLTQAIKAHTIEAHTSDTKSPQAHAQISHALNHNLPKQAAQLLASHTDTTHGGMQGAPKFPQTLLFGFLWQAWLLHKDTACRDAVINTLDNICCGGIYDHIGGGFARYTVDKAWLVPHFEKMLYDNALILDLLGTVWKQTKNPLYENRITQTINWLIDEMRLPAGAFAASLDADTKEGEGVFYTWQEEELKTILESNYTGFAAAYGVTEEGNFEGRNILHRLGHESQFADEAGYTRAREKLQAIRNKRPRPPCDDKILADWNGLMIASLARLAVCFARPAWLDHAIQAYDFIRQNMCITDENGLQLYHLFRPHMDESKMSHHTVSLAEDYANMINAALALFSATGKEAYLQDAESLTSYLEAQFWDKNAGGYYMTAQNAETLIMRPCHASDNATPSANSTMIGALTRLAGFTGKQTYMDKAHALIARFAPLAEKNFPQMTHYLTQLQNACRPVTCVIIGAGGDNDKEKDYYPLLEAAHKHSLPNLAIQISNAPQTFPKTHPAYGKALQQGKPTAYLCPGQTCLAPVVTAKDLTAQLDEILEKGF